MQRLLLEVQAEKERLIRSLAAGSVENIITSSDECQNNGSSYTSPNSLNVLDTSFNPPSSIVASPTKDSSPESRTQSISDIGASASQVIRISAY